MKEFGKSTVSRSGRIGSSGGIESGRSAVVEAVLDRGCTSLAHARYLNREHAAGGKAGSCPASRREGLTQVVGVSSTCRRRATRRPRRCAITRSRCSRHLPRLLAVLAADRERQRAQALLRDLLTALEAVAVGPLLQTRERLVDLVERLGLHLDERELDLFLDVGFRALGRVEHALLLPSGTLDAHVADLLVYFAHDLPAPLFENAPELGMPVVHMFLLVFRVHDDCDSFPPPIEPERCPLRCKWSASETSTPRISSGPKVELANCS